MRSRMDGSISWASSPPLRDRIVTACTVNDTKNIRLLDHQTTPEVDVVVEVPRGSFLKRGSTGHVDFISPLPCPFNYGSVPTHIGQEGDLLDALVLGPRLPLGARVRVKAWGAVTLTDRGMSDDKLVCGQRAPTASQRRNLLRFFRFYAKSK